MTALNLEGVETAKEFTGEIFSHRLAAENKIQVYVITSTGVSADLTPPGGKILQ
jgi:hypothetical protein